VELDFWQEAIVQLNQLKPLFWLAEMEPSEFPAYMEVFDAAYSWNWMHKSEEWYQKGLPLKTLLQVLADYETVPGIKAWFTSNHDENSWNGTEYEKYGEAALCLAIHSITWPGIPLIYSGQEMPNKKRLLFFDKDHIDWSSTPALHHFYKTLLDLQRSHPALDARSDHYLIHTSADTNMLSYLRKKDEQEVLVLLNLSAHHTRFDVLSSWVKGRFREIFSANEIDISSTSFAMRPWEHRVYVKITG
jgi:glycosidase